MSNLNFYPLKRARDKLPEDEQPIVTPGKKEKFWSYFFGDKAGERLLVCVNNRYDITNVAFTHGYKHLGLSLKAAKRKGYKACWHIGNADKRVSL